jgi:hypothetical protein
MDAYLVRPRDLLELAVSLLLVVGVLVGVPLHGELAVGLLQIVVGGALVHAQDLVVVQPHGWIASLLSGECLCLLS